MIYIFLAAATMLCCSQIKSSNQLLQVSSVPLAVGAMYTAYKAYEGYTNEYKKIQLIQDSVNGDIKALIGQYDTQNESDLEIKSFLEKNEKRINDLANQQGKEKNSTTRDEQKGTGNVSKKDILNELNKNKNQTLKNNLDELTLYKSGSIGSLLEIVVTGQHALFQKIQEVMFGNSVSHFIGRKVYNFQQKNAGEKVNTLASLAVNSTLILICVLMFAVALCWPLLLLYSGIRNIDLGFKINKKYHNGVGGWFLERYFVKK